MIDCRDQSLRNCSIRIFSSICSLDSWQRTRIYQLHDERVRMRMERTDERREHECLMAYSGSPGPFYTWPGRNGKYGVGERCRPRLSHRPVVRRGSSMVMWVSDGSSCRRALPFIDCLYPNWNPRERSRINGTRRRGFHVGQIFRACAFVGDFSILSLDSAEDFPNAQYSTW